jgi:hypothetical protein
MSSSNAVRAKPGAKAQPNKDLKGKCYLALFVGHHMVAQALGLKIPKGDVTTWSNITSYCATLFKISLQLQGKADGEMVKLLGAGKKWGTGEGVAVSIVYEAWTESLKEYGFTFDEAAGKEWIGTMSSLLTLMNAFSRRMNEIRVPTMKFLSRPKKSGPPIETSLNSWGLEKSALPFLEGITFAPHLKSAMINSLGPLTIAIGLASCYDINYAEKWRNAFRATWGGLDCVEELIDDIEAQGNGCAHVLKSLSNLCQFGIPRVNGKAFIPFVAINIAMQKINAAKMWSGNPCIEMVKDLALPDALKNIDSSGHGMWHIYNMAAGEPLTMIGPEGTGKELGQLYMHSFLGTNKDDLGLVEWCIGAEPGTFLTRSEIGSKLQGKVGTKKPIQITTYIWGRICKISSASGTSLTSGGEGQIQRMAVLSGKVIQEITPESKILSILKDAGSSIPFRQRVSVADKLAALTEKLVKRVAKEARLEWGSTSFYAYNAETNGSAYGAIDESKAILSGRYFYGNA